MEGQRFTYRTRQREAVSAYLAERRERYLSVDDVWSGIRSVGSAIGRSTVYRCLEGMAADGMAWKVVAPGGEARYRAVGGGQGQLVCLECGRAFSLDCHMIDDFSHHVLDHHGFAIDPSRTVLYGRCDECAEAC